MPVVSIRWVTDPEEIAAANAVVPTGLFTLRTGERIICLTVPPAEAPKTPVEDK